MNHTHASILHSHPLPSLVTRLELDLHAGPRRLGATAAPGISEILANLALPKKHDGRYCHQGHVFSMMKGGFARAGHFGLEADGAGQHPLPKRAGKHQLLGNLESLVKIQLSCSKSCHRQVFVWGFAAPAGQPSRTAHCKLSDGFWLQRRVGYTVAACCWESGRLS